MTENVEGLITSPVMDEDEIYNNMMDKEKIVENWLLVNTPVPVVVVILLYLTAVLGGKRWMTNRRPYQLTSVLRVYDLALVAFNMYLIYGYIETPETLYILINKYCSLDIMTPEYRYHFLHYSWGFYFSKLLDLLDTIFFVLRKKNSHISFLHVYHHVAMAFCTWLTLRHAKAFQAALPAFINLIVHVIMYSYYFLATFPSLEPYLWWKKHLTKLQMAQFVIAIFYIGRIYYNGCQISRVFTYIWVFNVFAFLCLFFNFYVNTYLRPQTKEKIERKKS